MTAGIGRRAPVQANQRSSSQAGGLRNPETSDGYPQTLTLEGSLIGCLLWFGLGRLVNERHLERFVRARGRWFGLSPSRLRLSRRWFRRHGWQIVCWGRLVPILRTNVSLPAGIEMMPLGPFLSWSSLGIGLWNGVFIGLGYALGSPSLP